jgi:hypothetical protein
LVIWCAGTSYVGYMYLAHGWPDWVLLVTFFSWWPVLGVLLARSER